MNTPNDSFDREWISIGDHRILLRQRDGAPGIVPRRCALLAAWAIEGNVFTSSSVRVVEVFHENRDAYRTTVILGTDDPGAHAPEESIVDACSAVFDGMETVVDLVVIRPGRKESDRYDHTAHVVRGVLRIKREEAFLA